MRPRPFLSRPFRSRLLRTGLLLALFLPTAGTAEMKGDDRFPLDGLKPVVCAQAVLAIDGSGSTEKDAFARQIAAFEGAFADPRLYNAIDHCLPGSFAFVALTWSSPNQQERCVNWTAITNDEQGLRAAKAFHSCRYIGGTTDIGRALDAALDVLEDSPFDSYYRIVFLLTNGRTDRGSEGVLREVRAEAASKGVTIDGYALLKALPKAPSPFFVPDAVPLEKYMPEHVTAGPRSFSAHSRPGDDLEGIVRALVEMLRQEIS
jgi:hypothetical protein